MNRLKRHRANTHWYLVSLCLLTVLTMPTHAQTIDYDLNQATRSIKDVSDGLDRLRPGDVSNYNRLSGKLTKAAGHLESTQSKDHPDFAAAVQRWGELQARMATIAQEWQAAAAAQQAAAPPPPAPAQPQQQAAPQPAAAPAPAGAAAPPKPQVEAVNLDPLMDKYQRNNLPELSESATAEEARSWAMHMKSLQTTTLEADLATIESALSSGAASESDATRVRNWISNMFQDNIQRTVQQEVLSNEGTIKSMVYSADLINGVAEGDQNGAYRFAAEDKYENNASRLDNALRAGAVAEVFDEVLGTSSPERAAILDNLRAARSKLDTLRPLAEKQAAAFASAPRKEAAVAEDFLAPVAQEFWLNGSIMAESDDEGGIWVSGDNVGDITHNGQIWVQANDRGSIEPNGDVWFDGNEVGSLETNGEVWRDGNQVGLIDKDGKVWINGSADGEIVPFQDEWRRAAILYYFGDLFR